MATPDELKSHVVSGLVSKRAELAGRVQHHQNEIRRLGVDLAHLDATLRLFAPALDLRGIKPRGQRRPNPHFRHGESRRLILDVLREAAKPLTSRAIAEAMLSRKGVDARGEDLEAVQKIVLCALRRMETQGVARESGKDAGGQAFVWELV